MPQMAPTNWMLLLMYFIIIFIMFNIMNYYIFSLKINTQQKKMFYKKQMNWKW